jgi:hypothetical protein
MEKCAKRCNQSFEHCRHVQCSGEGEGWAHIGCIAYDALLDCACSSVKKSATEARVRQVPGALIARHPARNHHTRLRQKPQAKKFGYCVAPYRQHAIQAADARYQPKVDRHRRMEVGACTRDVR